MRRRLLHRVGMTMYKRTTWITAVALAAVVGFPTAAVSLPDEEIITDDRTIIASEWEVDPSVGSRYYAWPGFAGDSWSGLGLWRSGSATGEVYLHRPATRVILEAGADRCPVGVGARATVLVDGEPALTDILVDADMGWYTAEGDWAVGPHEVEVRYTNDHRDESCDRNLKVLRVMFESYATRSQANVQLRASSLRRTPLDAGVLFTKGIAGEPTQLLWTNARVTAEATTQEVTDPVVFVRAASHVCEGRARMVVRIDGRYVGQQEVLPDFSAELLLYRLRVPFTVPAGSHELSVEFVNDYRSEACDRNLKVGSVSLAGGWW